ncbi:bifunctional DNA primase/polymerase [Marinitoga aeolica]|uniref:Bifunctional DNA primase/polymerase n=1 Tax=Marinitoga aeolica TaxID=2809031 RepID=A0ABY8PRD0_9BACT|nr:bifunctional DNA primase/polymerase [Marinitoga aeolica]WGS65176.1 bifunctional DNA primase/polymerase [Marinitoga aeolica]
MNNGKLTRVVEMWRRNNFKVIPLYNYQKRPIFNDWPHYVYNEKDFEKITGYGLLTGIKIKDDIYFHVIDIDVYDNTKNNLLKNIINYLKLKNPFIQKTVSGGYHIFFVTNKVFNKSKIVMNNYAIELLGKGQIVVGYGSQVYSNKTNKYGVYELLPKSKNINYIESKIIDKMFNYKQKNTLNSKIIS